MVVRHLKSGSVSTWQELHIEVRNKSRNCQFAHGFDESFAYADALAAQKGCETECVSGFTCRREKVGTFAVETVWDESFGLLPLFWIVVQFAYID